MMLSRQGILRLTQQMQSKNAGMAEEEDSTQQCPTGQETAKAGSKLGKLAAEGGC